MALATVPSAKITFDLLDESGTSGKTVLHCPSSTLVADIITSSDGMVSALQALTGCVVRGYSIGFSRKDPILVAPSDGARIENKGVFILTLANNLFTRVEVPGILESVLLPSGSIDVENGAVQAFLTALITSPAVFRGLDGSDIVGIRSAFQRFRSSTPNQLPSDRVKFG